MNFLNHRILMLTAAVLAGGVIFFRPTPVQASALRPDFWRYHCIDTMKDSRDQARNISIAEMQTLAVKEIGLIKAAGANCVAIGTPYDDEFIPVLNIWANEAHKRGLIVWFRGNFSGWEGWFDYPILQSVDDHHQKITRFVKNNPGLFVDGDIFTPAPEPEQGKVIGDPRQSDGQKTEYLNFLTNSYSNCVKAFAGIHRTVNCGYFSVNGDIAKTVLTPDVVKKTGNIIVVDHYVASPQQLISDLVFLHDKFKTKIMLGEFGAPVPDINGDMTEDQQADFVNQVLLGATLHTDFLQGVNYWVLKDGSTSLLRSDNSLKKSYTIVQNFYKPSEVKGKVVDTAGKSIADAQVKNTTNGIQAFTDANGNFIMPAVPGNVSLQITKNGFVENNQNIFITSAKDSFASFTLKQSTFGWWGSLWQFLTDIF